MYKSLLNKQCGVEVISKSESIIDGPFGSLIERIIEWFDEFYSLNLSEEVFRGMKEKASRGGYQARPPLGYKIEQKGEPPVIVEEEAKIVRIIFDKYVNEDMGLFAISRYLNSLDLKPLTTNHLSADQSNTSFRTLHIAVLSVLIEEITKLIESKIKMNGLSKKDCTNLLYRKNYSMLHKNALNPLISQEAHAHLVLTSIG